MKFLLLLTLAFTPLICRSQADCPPTVVCVGQSATVVNGLTNELNASNRGCLASSEATASYWYEICALNNGTIRFTISPAGSNNDYDWAVWGPNSACPPTSAPIRCSYALSSIGPGGDNTGVNSTNNSPETDNSEGVFGNQWTQDIIAAAGQCFLICVNNYGPGSNNFSISFSGTAGLDCGVLPVEMVSFKAECKGEYNLITWTCATETDNDFFILERSIDGYKFDHVAALDGAGVSTELTTYTHNDYNFVKDTINYYRIEQVDMDGASTYYHIISVNNKDKEKPTLVKIVTLMGTPVPQGYTGIYVEMYSDGTCVKKCCIMP